MAVPAGQHRTDRIRFDPDVIFLEQDVTGEFLGICRSDSMARRHIAASKAVLPPGAGGAPGGSPADQRRSLWQSEVDHRAINVVVAGRGGVARDVRLLKEHSGTGGDVEAAADPLAGAAPGPRESARGRVGGDGGLLSKAEPPVPAKRPPPQPLPPPALAPPAPPWATLPVSVLPPRDSDDVSAGPNAMPPMAKEMAPPRPPPPVAPEAPAPPWARFPPKVVFVIVAVEFLESSSPPPKASPPLTPLAPPAPPLAWLPISVPP